MYISVRWSGVVTKLWNHGIVPKYEHHPKPMLDQGLRAEIYLNWNKDLMRKSKNEIGPICHGFGKSIIKQDISLLRHAGKCCKARREN